MKGSWSWGQRAENRNATEPDIVAPIVRVSTTVADPVSTAADTVVVGLFAEEALPAGAPTELGDLLSSKEARTAFKALALTHADGRRWLIAGLGARADFTCERARVLAAAVRDRTRELSAQTLCMSMPANIDPGVPAALTEGTILADYRFDMHKSSDGNQDEPPRRLEHLILCTASEPEPSVAAAAIVAVAVNSARDLQNRPANDLTPTVLGRYAVELAENIESLSVQTEGRGEIIAHDMGAFAAVARGSDEEPALITLRYQHPDASGPTLGFVGKAVTFDSGGISLKPGAKMSEMKFDMSGGAAVLEAVAAIARLELPVNVLAVVGATENLPSGHAVKPGDIVTAANGKTIEVNNTDAEGRLVLADCLHHAISLGAELVIDLATLTGAVTVALGSTYAGLISNDDELAGRVSAAGERSGEIVWRLPLHEEYDELIRGRYGDLDNAPEDRKAGTITGAAFLSNFVGETPWAHLDIAGSAWDLGRAYAPKSASGYGVRLLVELARSYCG
jgi:leucyl aminopeptidase